VFFRAALYTSLNSPYLLILLLLVEELISIDRIFHSLTKRIQLFRFSGEDIGTEDHLPKAFIVHIWIGMGIRCRTAIFLAESTFTLLL
jgi:hypothetical protein